MKVVLKSCGKAKLQVMKVLKEVLGMDYYTAKTSYADNTPCVILDTPDKALAEVLESYLASVGATVEIEGVFADIDQLVHQKKYDEALALLDERAIVENSRDSFDYHFLRGQILVKQEAEFDDVPETRESVVDNEFNKALEFCDKEDSDEKVGDCNFWRALHYYYLGKNFLARNYFILAMESKSEGMRDEAENMVQDLETGPLTEIWDTYTSCYDYQDRKFIMPIRDSDIAGCFVSGIDTFRMSNIPKCIKFPAGHPVSGELYVGHPFNPSLYVPYSESEEIFFDDKIDELTNLLQSLGAEEITITSIKGKNVSEYEARGKQGDIHIGVFNLDGKVSGGKIGEVERNRDSWQQRSRHIKCDPMKYPYVPEGLAWYGEQPKWQRMAEGRLNGNRLEYSEFISSSETRFVSKTEKKQIKAAAERLWIKIEGSAESNLETQFKEHTETQWKVDVKFRSLKDFTKVPDAETQTEPSVYTEQKSSVSISPELQAKINKYVSDAWDAARDLYNDWIAENATPERLESFLDRLETNQEIQFELTWRYFLEALFRYNAMSEPGINDLEQYIRAEVAINNAIMYEEENDPEPELHLLKGLIAFEPVYYQNDKNQGLRFTEKNKQTFLECKEYLKRLEEFDGIVFQEKELYQENYAFCELYFDNPTEFWRRFNEEKRDSLVTTLTEDEQEYLRAYKDYAIDGEVSERDRKKLGEYRTLFGISEERARELEVSCSKPQLNEDEQKYLKMYKVCASDGEITEKDRKMLNSVRDRMGISEERAKEIEQL